MEHWWHDADMERRSAPRKIGLSTTLCSTVPIHTHTGLDSNPVICGDRPATDRLGRGTVCQKRTAPGSVPQFYSLKMETTFFLKRRYISAVMQGVIL